MKGQNEANKFCDGKPNGQLIVASQLNTNDSMHWKWVGFSENQFISKHKDMWYEITINHRVPRIEWNNNKE